jgi:predicted TIM-barrel fold metal-dependent hydrolase
MPVSQGESPLSHTNEPPPAFRAPALACDAHFHVFGPAERYPHRGVNEALRYVPPLAPLSDYLALAGQLGFERFVLVQPSAYGRDNACMLDAMREIGIARCRGIVDVDENAPDALLAEMHAVGVRGVRINVSPVKPPSPGFSATMRPRIERLAARCAELGWQLDFLHPGWLTEELMPVFAKLPCAFTIAHMGMFLAKDGVQQAGFQKLLDLLRHGEGRAWVKLTGAYRMATLPTLADAAPMARALIAAAPDRLIWGSDYPHLSFTDKVGSVQLFNLLADWAPDEATRRRILVDNPAALFGF